MLSLPLGSPTQLGTPESARPTAFLLGTTLHWRVKTLLWSQPSAADKGTVLGPSFFTCKRGYHSCFTGLGKDQRRRSRVPRHSEAGPDYFIIKKHYYVFLSENDPKFVYFIDCFVFHQRGRFCFHKLWLLYSLPLLNKLRVGGG